MVLKLQELVRMRGCVAMVNMIALCWLTARRQPQSLLLFMKMEPGY
jgi:hypothetical protein